MLRIYMNFINWILFGNKRVKIVDCKKVNYSKPLKIECEVKKNNEGNVNYVSKTETFTNNKAKYEKVIRCKCEPETGLSADGISPVYMTLKWRYDKKDFDFTKLIETNIKITALEQGCDVKYIYVISEEQYQEENKQEDVNREQLGDNKGRRQNDKRN